MRLATLLLVLASAAVHADPARDFIPVEPVQPDRAAPRAASPALAQAVTALREGERLLRGQGVVRDPVAACARFDEAAKEPLPQAWLRVGHCHAQGQGRPVDKAAAAQWYRRAAESGMAAGQTAWGLVLQRGEGVERDPAAALGWFGRAAQAGDSNAALALARAYEAGLGAPRDLSVAARWMQHAADQRNPAAQLVLSQWYQAGQVVERSALFAYVWAQIASEAALRVSDPTLADHLSQRALTVRRQSAGSLNAEELVEGQRLARQWQPGAIALRSAPPAGPLAAADAAPRAADSAPQTSAAPASPGPPAQPNPAEANPGAPTPPPPPRGRIGTGSGFFVSLEGHVVTNEHVVRDCREIRLGNEQPVRVIAIDRQADLALLKAAPVSLAAVLRTDSQAQQGEDVITYGFPLRGVLSSSGQLGAGMVTALSGLRDNPLQIQIDVPVQPGNSGGPLLDGRGEVVGVVVSKLNALRVAQVTGDIPQNVNFAVALAPLKKLLAANEVRLQTPARDGSMLTRQQIAERARQFTVPVLCTR